MSNISKQDKVRHNFMEPILVGDTGLDYVERAVEKFAWRCEGCGLVWATRHQAVECESRRHVSHYTVRYCSGPVVNGRPSRETFYDRDALRRDKVTA